MRIRYTTAALSLLAMAALTPPAAAQDKATELTAGVFGISNLSSDGVNLLQIATGGAYVAAGFYLSPEFALEPTIGNLYQKVESYSQTRWTLGLALPYYFDKNWGRKGVYASPRLVWTSYSCSNCDGASQLALGAAVGYKLPLNESAALRIQGGFDYGFRNDNFESSTTIGMSVGLSVFLQ